MNSALDKAASVRVEATLRVFRSALDEHVHQRVGKHLEASHDEAWIGNKYGLCAAKSLVDTYGTRTVIDKFIDEDARPVVREVLGAAFTAEDKISVLFMLLGQACDVLKVGLMSKELVHNLRPQLRKALGY